MDSGDEDHPHVVDPIPNVEIPIAPSSISDSIVDLNIEIPPGPSSLWEREQGRPLEDEIMENVLPSEVFSSKGKHSAVCESGVSPSKMEFSVPPYQGEPFPALL
ncbi:hypothetical protein AMTR_s00050p00214410 [Amborella trichopoda]|uniref:Uncharacterized protein n=1 Tax=Amborella trichopoda TaxID=13333 RepID=W1PZC3_AMBTC|nr:hypothetical protein AMTR_s00050p00214410 [Amborella trichopoda]